MTIAAMIAEHSSLPPDAVKEWSSSSSSGSMNEIQSVILFVLATWSGQSISAFKSLTERLANTPAAPALMVCDIDDLSSEAIRLFGGLRGMGETFWIHKGQVVATLREYKSDEWRHSVDRNNELLLELLS